MKHTAKSIVRTLTALGLVVALLLGGAVTALGASTAITEAQAKEIALIRAGVQSSEVAKWIKLKLDDLNGDGDREWDVVFRTAFRRYEVEINADSGAVEEFESRAIGKKGSDRKPEKRPAQKLSEAEARAIALERAGVAEADVVKWTKSRLDKSEWEFKFRTATHAYEVEISAKTGKVREFEKKKLKLKPDESALIGKERAKEIAIAHAQGEKGISGGVQRLKVKLDRERGRTVYEVDFRSGGFEFEYEIDAATGEILHWDIERDD